MSTADRAGAKRSAPRHARCQWGVSGPGGVWILSPEGKHLGTIKGPELAANFAFGGDDRKTLAVSCSAGALPGSDAVLETRHARLHMASTRVAGSGPTGPSVALTLGISFKPSARGRSTIELAASDDTGLVDNFTRAASVIVLRRADDR